MKLNTGGDMDLSPEIIHFIVYFFSFLLSGLVGSFVFFLARSGRFVEHEEKPLERFRRKYIRIKEIQRVRDSQRRG